MMNGEYQAVTRGAPRIARLVAPLLSAILLGWAASPAAAQTTVRYEGTHSRGDTMTLTVTRDGKQVTKFSARNLPLTSTTGESCPGRVGLYATRFNPPLQVKPDGSFTTAGTTIGGHLKLEGRLRNAGTADGTLNMSMYQAHCWTGVLTWTAMIPRDDAPVDNTAPVLSGLKFSPKRFAAADSGEAIAAAVGGSKFSYSLSEKANTIWWIQRAKPGRRVGGKCVKPTRQNRKRRRCIRGWKTLKPNFAHFRGEKGNNSFRFTGRLNSWGLRLPSGKRANPSKALRPGAYRLRGFARDFSNNRSPFRKARFWIKR